MNELICWVENGIQKWAMIKKSDFTSFGMELLTNKNVDKHTIFIIPESSIFSGLWLVPETHKSNRVDFFHFHEDIGIKYEKPKVSEKAKELTEKYEEKYQTDTKYGWISPEGKYFHCDYQGHSSLADRICFGMVDTDNPERYLEEHGWCKIYKSLFSNKYSVYVGGNYCLTDAQMKVLIGMELDTAEGISEALCKNKEDDYGR